MEKPNELAALKSQLDNLLDERLAGIAPSRETATAAKPTSEIVDEPVAVKVETVDQPATPEDAAPSLDNPERFDENETSDSSFIQKALKRANGPFVVYGDNYRVIYANDMARDLWPETIGGIEAGLSITEATANQIRALVPTLSEQEVQTIAAQTIASHSSNEPNEVMGKDGRWFRLHHDKVDGEFICSMGVEISELKRREAQLEEAKKVADDANLAKSAFLAKMSHEIKTPLNAIVGMSDALLEDVDDEEVRETLDYIITAAEGLTHVLGQTLDHAKLISEKVTVELQEHQISEVIHKVCGVWKKQCTDKSVKLNVHIHPNVPDLLVFDRFRFQQCLNNLMSNAIKFTEKGHITVALKKIEKPGKGPSIALVVQDSGVGMSEEARSRIFKPYEQADKSTSRLFGGTGLGLTITKQLVEAMGGSISIQSDLGKGTAFLLTLPADLAVSDEPVDALIGMVAETPQRRSPEPESAPVQDEPAAKTDTDKKADTPFAGLSVLCVEDNPVNHAVIKKLIGKQVKSIAFASNGEEGLRALSAQHFDVVLMDIHMPIMDGIEATLKIRGSDKPWADVVIIAVTADPDFQYQRVCRNIGMNDAIGKPVKRQDILDSITRSLDVLKETHAQRVELPIAV